MYLEERQQKVIDRGYAKEIYEFALNEPGSDPILLSEALANAKDMPERYYINEFGEEYPLFEDEPLEYYLYSFARDVKGADIDVLSRAIYEKASTYYAYLFARDIEGANVELLELRMVEPFSEDLLYEFATEVPGANTKFLEKGIPYADLDTMYNFAKNIEGADIEFIQTSFIICIDDLLHDHFLSEDDYNTIYEFVRDVKGASVDDIINDKIDEYKDMKFLYLVARDIKDVNLDLIERRMLKLMESDGVYYLDKYVDDVEGANLKRIENDIECYLIEYPSYKNKKGDDWLYQFYELLEKINKRLEENQVKLLRRK